MAFRHFLTTLVPGVFCCAVLSGQTYTITTVAGNGLAAFSGDNGPASNAQLNLPTSIALDSAGNIYIADTVNNRVRKILATNGNITTIAGTGTSGFSGDAGQATSATLRQPAGVAVDGSGNVYIADTGNNVVRKVTSGGVISTFAGNNPAGPGYEGDNGQANVAKLNQPTGLALDSAGNVYIADSINNAVRRVSPTGVITTFVAPGAGLLSPTSIALDSSGALLIADGGNNRVVRFAAGTANTLAGNFIAGFSGDGGKATAAELNNPKGVVADSAGNVYIADANNSRIRKVTPDGTIVTVAGSNQIGYGGDNGPAVSALLAFPNSVVVDANGNLYFTDSNNHAVRELQPAFPLISNNGIGNAASGSPQISPGALASIYGTYFATAGNPAQSLPLGTLLGGVSVTVNGKPAPLLYTGPNQINFQVPWSTAPGTASVVVKVAGGTSNTASIPVKTAAPGIFFEAVNGQAVAANFPENTLNTPNNPAASGSTIIVYLTGSGPVDNTPADGAAPSGLSRATSPFSASIGPANAPVTFLGLAPGLAGVVQANITIPAGLAPGTYPMTVTIAGETSNTVNISVK